MRRAVLVLVLPLALLAGCGGRDASTATDDPASQSPAPSHSSKPSSTPSSAPSKDPTSPRCGAVWSQDATLPGQYQGCATSAGWVEAEDRMCSTGAKIVTYADHFWAVRGHRIERAHPTLLKDARYRHLLAQCSA